MLVSSDLSPQITTLASEIRLIQASRGCTQSHALELYLKIYRRTDFTTTSPKLKRDTLSLPRQPNSRNASHAFITSLNVLQFNKASFHLYE
jgi:hypothetical protein